jgi:NADH-quinone oxidoreductase subunit K
MFLVQIASNIFLFFIGLFGIILNRRNILIVLMCLEIVLLSLNLNFIVMSSYLDDFSGQIFAFFVLTVAAAESAVGLAVIIIYYRLRGSITMFQPVSLKG